MRGKETSPGESFRWQILHSQYLLSALNNEIPPARLGEFLRVILLKLKFQLKITTDPKVPIVIPVLFLEFIEFYLNFPENWKRNGNLPVFKYLFEDMGAIVKGIEELNTLIAKKRFTKKQLNNFVNLGNDLVRILKLCANPAVQSAVEVSNMLTQWNTSVATMQVLPLMKEFII